MAPELDACPSAPHLTSGPANLTVVQSADTGESIKVDAKAFTSDMVVVQIDPGTQRTATPTDTINLFPSHPMLIPRDGVSPTWNEYIRDKISAERLTRIVDEKKPPTLSDIQTALAGSIEYGNAKHHHAVIKKLWWEEATRLYKIVRPTLNLTGLFPNPLRSPMRTS